jgi:hypothetical protein
MLTRYPDDHSDVADKLNPVRLIHPSTGTTESMIGRGVVTITQVSLNDPQRSISIVDRLTPSSLAMEGHAVVGLGEQCAGGLDLLGVIAGGRRAACLRLGRRRRRRAAPGVVVTSASWRDLNPTPRREWC